MTTGMYWGHKKSDLFISGCRQFCADFPKNLLIRRESYFSSNTREINEHNSIDLAKNLAFDVFNFQFSISLVFSDSGGKEMFSYAKKYSKTQKERQI